MSYPTDTALIFALTRSRGFRVGILLAVVAVFLAIGVVAIGLPS